MQKYKTLLLLRFPDLSRHRECYKGKPLTRYLINKNEQFFKKIPGNVINTSDCSGIQMLMKRFVTFIVSIYITHSPPPLSPIKMYRRESHPWLTRAVYFYPSFSRNILTIGPSNHKITDFLNPWLEIMSLHTKSVSRRKMNINLLMF